MGDVTQSLYPLFCTVCGMISHSPSLGFFCSESVTGLCSSNPPPYIGHLISVANISFHFTHTHSSLFAVRGDKIPGKQSRSSSLCIVFAQQWRLEWCMGVEADKCGILNRVKALLPYPFGGGCPALKR